MNLSPPAEIPAEPLTMPGGDARALVWRRRAGIAVAMLCWLYFFVFVASWLLIRIAGDRWWPATMFLFGPRWIFLLPLLVLVPLAIAVRRRCLWGLLITAILVAIPFMDLRVTRRGLFPIARSPSSLRILTLNTHSGAVNPIQLKMFIDQTKPDIVALEEWHPANREIVFPEAWWHTVQLPEAIVASRYPVQSIGQTMRDKEIIAGITYRYNVQLPGRDLAMYCVHLSSPHTPFRDVLHHAPNCVWHLTRNSIERSREADRLQHESDDDTILVGDFNLPRDSTIYRAKLSGFLDAFTDAGLGYGLTYYSRWTAVRIDHVLMGKNWECESCWVGPDVGSPHRPVIADLARRTF